MSRFVIACALALAACHPLMGQGGKQTAEHRALVKQVFDAWRKRRAQHKSVRYVVKGERLLLKETNFLPDNDLGRKAGWHPKQDKRSSRECSLLIDLVRSRHRMETKESILDPTEEDLETKRSIVTAFNGKQLVQANLRDPGEARRSAHDGVITTGNLRGNGFPTHDWPPFLAHGIVPTAMTHLNPGGFDVKPDQAETYVHGTAWHKGRECIVLRTEPDHLIGRGFDEFWVDMKRGGAVLRYVWYVDGKMVHDLDVRYGDEAGWPLSGWTFTLQNNGKTTQVHEMRVESCEPDAVLAADSFDVRLAPGMKMLRINKGGDPNSFSPRRPSRKRRSSSARMGTSNPGRRAGAGFGGAARCSCRCCWSAAGCWPVAARRVDRVVGT
ncbi:MAG: hypothetical protein K2W96_25440 [Gemmataceae bacterium]|nr:hypothetical protein [Gemmataceae bacterium]